MIPFEPASPLTLARLNFASCRFTSRHFRRPLADEKVGVGHFPSRRDGRLRAQPEHDHLVVGVVQCVENVFVNEATFDVARRGD